MKTLIVSTILWHCFAMLFDVSYFVLTVSMVKLKTLKMNLKMDLLKCSHLYATIFQQWLSLSLKLVFEHIAQTNITHINELWVEIQRLLDTKLPYDSILHHTIFSWSICYIYIISLSYIKIRSIKTRCAGLNIKLKKSFKSHKYLFYLITFEIKKIKP